MLRDGRGHSWGTFRGTGDLVSLDGVGVGIWLWEFGCCLPITSFSRLPLPQHRVFQDEFEDLSSTLGFGVNLAIWGNA